MRDARGRVAVVQTTFGIFLPGGGIEAGEDELTGLRRELREEIGFEIVRARLIVKAAQFHWSEFYQEHFRKIGSFFVVEYTAPPRPLVDNEHTLVWLDPDVASVRLSQEFQRWALAEYLGAP